MVRERLGSSLGRMRGSLRESMSVGGIECQVGSFEVVQIELVHRRTAQCDRTLCSPPALPGGHTGCIDLIQYLMVELKDRQQAHIAGCSIEKAFARLTDTKKNECLVEKTNDSRWKETHRSCRSQRRRHPDFSKSVRGPTKRWLGWPGWDQRLPDSSNFETRGPLPPLPMQRWLARDKLDLRRWGRRRCSGKI